MSHTVHYTPDEIAIGAPCSVRGGTLTMLRGDIYAAFGRVTSIVGSGVFVGENGDGGEGLYSLKSVSGFDGSADFAYESYGAWKGLGFSGAPSSPASFFRQYAMNDKRSGKMDSRVSASANALRQHISGGWIENFYRGYVYNRVYHYDVNRAYLGAISNRGLPSRIYPYSKRMPYSMFLANGVRGSNLPKYMIGDRVILTSEDLDTYDIEKYEFVHGVSFRDYDVNLNDTLYPCASLAPRLWKRITQSYWGVFAMREPITVDYRNGNSRNMHNYLQNVLWAQIIIRRVAAQVYNAARDRNPISVFVDSVLCEDPFDSAMIGEDPGTWKCVDQYERGIYILNPGMWNPLPFNPKTLPVAKWKKHMGYKLQQ